MVRLSRAKMFLGVAGKSVCQTMHKKGHGKTPVHRACPGVEHSPTTEINVKKLVHVCVPPFVWCPPWQRVLYGDYTG